MSKSTLDLSLHDVKYYSADGVFQIKVPIEDQTLEMGLQWNEEDRTKITFNIYLSLYNKRKHIGINEDKKLSTGKYPFMTYKVALKCFELLEQACLKEKEFQDKDILIYCHWVDNRRRNAYYSVLHKQGYNYMMYKNQKVIGKWFRKEERVYES